MLGENLDQMSQRREDNSIQTRSCIRQLAWKVATAVAVSMFLLTTTHAWSEPVPGSLMYTGTKALQIAN